MVYISGYIFSTISMKIVTGAKKGRNKTKKNELILKVTKSILICNQFCNQFNLFILHVLEYFGYRLQNYQ
jgi:hypothetical protein